MLTTSYHYVRVPLAMHGSHWNPNFNITAGLYAGAQVATERPQEKLMWEAFAECVRRVRAGGRPDGAWPKQALLTQRVLCAVADSAADGCRIVQL